MNVMYISFIDKSDYRMSGVAKKIKGQFNAIKDEFNASYYSFIENKKMIIFNREDIKVGSIESNKHIIEKIGKRSSYYNELLDFLSAKEINAVYIRYNLSCPFFIGFLKKCKRLSVNIILEIPTFPYEKEIAHKYVKLLDSTYSILLKKYVDRIVTFSDHNTIFGIPTINTSNGLDLKSISIREPKGNINSIALLGVANVNKWHGYDRVILGLKKYYQTQRDIEISFTIVGQGQELENLRSLVIRSELEKYVGFKGYLTGVELDREFNIHDIGIVSLGIHRIGLDSVSTLKSKEYWARGLPMVKSYKDNDIDVYINEAVLNVPANDEPIDMEEIIVFNDKIYKSDVIDSMTNSAKRVVGWDIKMEPIIEYLKSIKN